jgi:hypothetical protein
VGLESGTQFPEVDLIEGEWVDYDEKVGRIAFVLYFQNSMLFLAQAALPVGISEMESKWARA